MVDIYMFEKQRDMAKDAKEYLETKLAECPEGGKKELEFAIDYCDQCRRASATIVDLLANDAKKKEDAKKPEEKKPVKKAETKKPVKKPEETKPETDNVDDLF